MQKRTFCQALGALIFGGFIMARQSVAATTNTSSAKPRLAVVYFSKGGNTESVAKAVQAMTGADIFEVKTVKPYPEAYKPHHRNRQGRVGKKHHPRSSTHRH